jgi:hypothetical protein
VKKRRESVDYFSLGDSSLAECQRRQDRNYPPPDTDDGDESIVVAIAELSLPSVWAYVRMEAAFALSEKKPIVAAWSLNDCLSGP